MLPTGGALCAVTQLSANNMASRGAKSNVDCGLQLASSNFAPGDIIVERDSGTRFKAPRSAAPPAATLSNPGSTARHT